MLFIWSQTKSVVSTSKQKCCHHFQTTIWSSAHKQKCGNMITFKSVIICSHMLLTPSTECLGINFHNYKFAKVLGSCCCLYILTSHLARSSSALCWSGRLGARRPAASSSSFISLATSLQVVQAPLYGEFSVIMPLCGCVLFDSLQELSVSSVCLLSLVSA